MTELEGAAGGKPTVAKCDGPPLVVIVDSREQLPYTFEGPRYAGTEVIRKALPEGDYSIAGGGGIVTVERKSLDDLVGCLTAGRRRFERELGRLRGYELAAVVVEGSFEDFAAGRYRSQMKPWAALQSIAAFTARYGVHFLFAGSRAAAECLTWSLLRCWAREQRERPRRLAAAAIDAQAGPHPERGSRGSSKAKGSPRGAGGKPVPAPGPLGANWTTEAALAHAGGGAPDPAQGARDGARFRAAVLGRSREGKPARGRTEPTVGLDRTCPTATVERGSR